MSSCLIAFDIKRIIENEEQLRVYNVHRLFSGKTRLNFFLSFLKGLFSIIYFVGEEVNLPMVLN
jgi:hypothetical protein